MVAVDGFNMIKGIVHKTCTWFKQKYDETWNITFNCFHLLNLFVFQCLPKGKGVRKEEEGGKLEGIINII